MKSAASRENSCELQNTPIIDVSNAHGGLGAIPGPRPSEGRLDTIRLATAVALRAVSHRAAGREGAASDVSRSPAVRSGSPVALSFAREGGLLFAGPVRVGAPG